jgi:hypothetical protein
MEKVDMGAKMLLETLAPDARARVERTFAAMNERGFGTVFVPDRDTALRTVLDMIPKGSAVAHGTSTTLIQIGLVRCGWQQRFIPTC